MRISIIIVTHNRCKHVLECLRSVVVQDYAVVEIIVVDNASTDDTCQQITAQFPNVRLLSQTENHGVSGGRNIGFHAAMGELCVCLDDDAIFLDPVTLSRIASYFTVDSKLGCLNLRVVDQFGNIVTRYIPRRDRKVIYKDSQGANFSGTGFAIPRHIFEELGGFWEMLNPYFGEDQELSYRLIDRGYHILHTPFYHHSS